MRQPVGDRQATALLYGPGRGFRRVVRPAPMADVENIGQSQNNRLAVPEVVGLIMRVEPCQLFIVPHLRAHFTGILFKHAVRVGVQVECAGIIGRDRQLVREVGFEKRGVAAPEQYSCGAGVKGCDRERTPCHG